MTHQHKSLIAAAALTLGLALPACSLPENFTFSDIDVAESKVTVTKTEDTSTDAEAEEATESTDGDDLEELLGELISELAESDAEDTSSKSTKGSTKSDSAEAEDAEDAADYIEGHTITVSGNVEVTVEPDMASFGFSVTTSAKTAKKAQTENATAAGDVVAALLDAGVDSASVQTTSTWLSPQWDFDSSDEGTITGYEMTTRYEIKDVAIDEVGDLMAKVVDAGANGIDGPNYYASTYDEAYAEALAKAVEASKPKAEVLAKAADVTLGKVVSITEGYQDLTYAYITNATMEMAAADGAGKLVVPDIQPGEISISAQVTVVYAIK